ncbi:arylesterase [Caballeronia sordidicola]|uniref:Arylesterase n=1 Tax=Caballeronia sordidicola TaxID=196367 RepID=A0A158H5G7_CABSO|nr:arylesterase [Caballeronia sordidicola]
MNWTPRATLARMAMIACVIALPAHAAAPVADTAMRASPGAPSIVVLGDSISAEYGLPRDTGWVALLRKKLTQERFDYSVANSSISGDTTSGGLARLPAALNRIKPKLVIVELGANDALRGVPLATTEANLRTIIEKSQAASAKVLLIGMYVPPNYGPDYSQKFHGVYEKLSKEKQVPLVPFLLAGIENKPEMFQADQIHPTPQAQPLLLNNVWPVLRPLLGTPSK